MSTILAVAGLCGWGSLACAQNTPSGTNSRDALILQAAAAYGKKNAAKVNEILPQVAGHPMEPWVDYWSMRLRIGSATPEEMRAFFKRWKGSYVEDRLRNDWLLVLGRQGRFDLFAQEYRSFVMRDDSQVLCYALLIDARNGHAAADLAKEAFIKIQPAYVVENGCNLLASELYKSKKMPGQTVWIKARRLVEVNRIGATQKVVAIVLPGMDATVQSLMSKPEKWLADQKKAYGSLLSSKGDTSRTSAKTAVKGQGALEGAAAGGKSEKKLSSSDKELLTLALIRLAAKSPEDAVAQLTGDWKNQLSADQRGWIYGVAARVMAQRLNSAKALDYYKHIEPAQGLSEDVLVWRARTQLRAAAANKKTKKGWQDLLTVINTLPPDLASESAWIYWRAIAMKQTANKENAQEIRLRAEALLESIAGFDGFYPQLAQEALGRLIQLPEPPEPATRQELNAAIDTPGLMRALYAIRMGLRSEGVREWNWNLRGRDERALQAAAQLACDEQVWDRCINTSERAKTLFNMQQRYPMPYKDLAVPRAQEVGLDAAFVYGLMRQESRFVADIKSSAGAAGLMQLMPGTAKWTAKKINMTDFQANMVTDPQANIELGTAYLQMSVEEFDGSELLAAAGYNAGPSRPRRWRNGPVLEGAVWAENVPFNETRNYVQTVLPAAVVYQIMLTGKPQSLQARLGKIGPHNPNVPDKIPDLP